MIAYAACVTDAEKFERICRPGLARVASPGDVFIQARHSSSIFAAYNEVLAALSDRDDLEALVLLHEDTEVLDPGFAELVRRRMAELDVGVVGVIGARKVPGLAWREGETFGRVLETRGLVDFGGGTHDVETVDGLLMALSPWAVRHLRFDEDTFSGFDGYDADFCAQVRAAGRRVVVTELPVAHRNARTGGDRATSDGDSFFSNDAAFRAKWLDRPTSKLSGPLAADGAASGAKSKTVSGVRHAHGGDGYFEHTRPELRALVPGSARRVLDVGCGEGGLGAALKAERDCEVIGLEGFAVAADRARDRLDDALCLDLGLLEALPPEAGSFDAIVFGDILEHLREPARLLRALLPSLAHDGVVVCSIPNIKHWTVVGPLLVADRWTYEDAGLLDRTHVHFFTLEEISVMLDELGLEAFHVGVNDLAPLPPELASLAELAAGFGADRAETAARLGAYQYLIAAKRANDPLASPAVGPSDGRQAVGECSEDIREDLRALVPPGAERVLDVAGLAHPDDGSSVDLDALEALPDMDGSFDAMVFCGVLERLRDPARLLEAVLPALAPDGVLVCSMPNVKHWSVLYPLLVEDRWTYADAGLLDRTHVHFFTLEEISVMLDKLGLEPVKVVPKESAPLPADLAALADLAGRFGATREEAAARLSADHYLVVARRKR